jgi:hypothetical protein
MSVKQARDPWTEEVRRAAYVAVELAAAKRTACERTFVYFLRTASAHGLTLAELCAASGLDAAKVLELTEPAAA